MDMHEILKMAIKELGSDASLDDVTAYIAACKAKQDAIDGAAAKEEKDAEKEVEAVEEMAAETAPLPVDLPIEDPAAMSAGAPPPVAAAPAAMAETTPEAAGAAQLESVLASAGTTLAALLARISEDPTGFKAWIGSAAGTTDGLPPSVNVPLTADYEGHTAAIAAMKADHAAQALRLSALEGHLTKRDETIAALTAQVTTHKAAASKTDEDRAKEAEAAKRADVSAKVDDMVKFTRLILPRDKEQAAKNREAWISLGMTQPERFTEMLSSLPPGVPIEMISAASTATTRDPSAASQDGEDSHLGEALVQAERQYLAAGMPAKEARAAARVTALRVNGTPTTKLTGAA